MKMMLKLLLLLPATCSGQQPQVPKVVPVPPLHSAAPVREPVSPPAREVRDSRDHLSFHLPAGWELTRKDGEVSTFHLDARSASSSAQMRLVASLAFNPYPQSTFEGAFFYVSSAPHLSSAACAAETSSKPFQALPDGEVGGRTFARGKDEHGGSCTESRDVAYTSVVEGSCLRFDLTVNTFCGGEVSGAQDLTEDQLQSIYSRLVGVLHSVTFAK